jgi:hypothetical protein
MVQNFPRYVSHNAPTPGLLLCLFSFNEVKYRVDKADGDFPTVTLIHLYNLARQLGLLSVQWSEIEGLIEIHGEERISCGKRPTGVESAYERFRVAMPVPTWAGSTTPSHIAGLQRSNAGRHLLLSSFCPLSKLVEARLESSHKDVVDFLADDIELALLWIKDKTKGTIQQDVVESWLIEQHYGQS